MRNSNNLRKLSLPYAAGALIMAFLLLIPSSAVCQVIYVDDNMPQDTVIITVNTGEKGKKAYDGAKASYAESSKQDIGQTSPVPASQQKGKATLCPDYLDQSVHNALAKMGLSSEHLEAWVAQHPGTTLGSLDDMTAKKQEKVANIADFIRKSNKSISPKVAWREACALVFYSQKYGIPAELSVCIANAESRFNPSAVSKSGALGVMQVMWKVHNGMLSAKGIAPTKDHMFDPERGIEAGVLILSRYVKAYGTIQSALNRYYGGISTAYLKKISRNMAQLQTHTEMSDF